MTLNPLVAFVIDYAENTPLLGATSRRVVVKVLLEFAALAAIGLALGSVLLGVYLAHFSQP